MTKTIFETVTESREALATAVLPLMCRACSHKEDCKDKQTCFNDILDGLDEPTPEDPDMLAPKEMP